MATFRDSNWRPPTEVCTPADDQQLPNRVADGKDQTENASQTKTRFLATVSHELRTPMNAILGLLHLVQTSGNLDQKDQEFIDTTYESAEHLLSLLNELLDLSKMEAGKVELEMSQFNLAQLTRKTLNISETKAHEKGLMLIDDISEQANVIVEGDAGRIQQILMNLLSNGIKFTDQGSVSLSTFRATADHFIFSVADTGVGFCDSQADALFQPFSQLDSTASRRHEGTGLGLAICERLVTAMGGSITARGRPDKGAVFRFEIPLSVISESPSCLGNEELHQEDLSPIPCDGEPLRVLIAEDSPANQIVLKAMLADTGYITDVVGNGLEAVEAIKRLDYDIVLMDIFMPEMDGLEATRIIRGDGRMNDKAIIALTANAMPGDRDKFLEAGMDDYLPKPVTKYDLLKMLNKWALLQEQ